MSHSVFVAPSRVFLAHLLMDQPLTFAIGTGTPEWDGLQQPATDDDLAKLLSEMSQQTALKHCIGFTRVRSKSFVVPDENGAIVMSDGSKWKKTHDPANALLVEGQLDLADATGVTLRESGIYAGTEFKTSVPPGQMYIPLADVTKLGTLVELTRFPAIVRDGSLAQNLFELLEI